MASFRYNKGNTDSFPLFVKGVKKLCGFRPRSTTIHMKRR